MTQNISVPDLVLEPIVRCALLEDLGSFGDVTTRTVIPKNMQYKARIEARETGVVSGMQLASLALNLVDPSLLRCFVLSDGDACSPGDTLMEISGNAASILSAERVALNFAGRLSGIASLTAQYVARVEGTKTRITCTRKTTPGLRIAEKLAVAHGGGSNHRFSLSDAILIKDNHIAAAGGVFHVLEACKSASHMLRVEIEVDRLDQLEQVLEHGGADAVLLDNMSTPDLLNAVQAVNGRMIVEASGSMHLDRIAEVAAAGVDYISVGALTHSAPTLDLGLDF